jgi:hypothetical protein
MRPTCTLVVSGIDISRDENADSSAGGTTLTLPAAAGAFFSVSAVACDRAVNTGESGTASLVSIHFETISSAQDAGGIISIEYN